MALSKSFEVYVHVNIKTLSSNVVCLIFLYLYNPISNARILGADEDANDNSDIKKGQRFENINIELTQTKTWIEKVLLVIVKLFDVIFFICHLKMRVYTILLLLTGC